MKKYSFFGNLRFMMKKAWKNSRMAVLLTAFSVPFSIALPFLLTLLSSKTVEYATEGVAETKLLLLISVLMLAITVATLLLRVINSFLPKYSLINRTKLGLEIKESVARTDYVNLENSDYNAMRNQAQQAVGSNAGIAESIFGKMALFLTNTIGIVLYSALIFKLSPIIILVLAVSTVLLYYVGKINVRWIQKNKTQWYEIDRKKQYILGKLGSFGTAKDVKLYGVSAWFYKIYMSLLGQRIKWSRKSEMRTGGIDILSAFITLLRDGLAYGLLIYKISKGNLSASEFVFYFAIIGQYSVYIYGIMNGCIDLYRSSLCISDVRNFLDYKSVMNHGKGADIFQSAPEIEFHDVCFRFPNSDALILDHISFKIKRGEKIALVGINGAGKTTLIKLVCGLFIPTDGYISVDGKNISEYNIEEYYSKISAVFQDIYTLPMSIEENIAGFRADIDYERLNAAIEKAGLKDKIDSLPDGLRTKLDKTLFKDATELSGGERQKLAMARALYKESPIVILDEPTAALDPIAEEKVYRIYHSLSDRTTSIFVSHRLASTRFCDRIFYMENGRILEEGTHESLMRNGGKYAEMFHAQSQYYTGDFKEAAE